MFLMPYISIIILVKYTYHLMLVFEIFLCVEDIVQNATLDFREYGHRTRNYLPYST